MKDCYDCEYAEFDTETYYGGGKQKIVTGCKDRDDMISTMHDLIMEGIEVDFRYERHGERGLWLEVIAVDS